MAFMIYLIGMLQNLQLVFSVIGALLGIGLPLLYLFAHDELADLKPLIQSFLFKAAIGLFIFSISWLIFVPSRNTVIAMYVIPKIVHNEQISHLSELGIKSTVKYLTTYLESQNSSQ